MDNPKIVLGDYELVHSGVVIQINQLPIKVTLPDEVEGDFSILFTFTSDDKVEEIVTQLKAIDKFLLSVEFINSDKMLNVGNIDLIPIGTLKNKPLFLQYRIFNMKDIGRTLTFNFYIGKEVANGDK